MPTRVEPSRQDRAAVQAERPRREADEASLEAARDVARRRAIEHVVSEVIRSLSDPDSEAFGLLVERVTGQLDPGCEAVRRVAEAVCERLEARIVALALATLDDPARAADVIVAGMTAADDSVDAVVGAVATRLRERGRGREARSVMVYGVVRSEAWRAFGDRWSAKPGGAVDGIGAAGLVAIVKRSAGRPGSVAGVDTLESRVREQAALLGSAARDATVVPLSIGLEFASDEAVGALLEARREQFESVLADLDDTAEWTVRVIRDGPAGGFPPSDVDLRRVRAALGVDSLARADRWTSDDPVEPLLSQAILVRRDRFAPFMATLERLSSELAIVGLTLESSGPWPAYHFVPPGLGR